MPAAADVSVTYAALGEAAGNVRRLAGALEGASLLHAQDTVDAAMPGSEVAEACRSAVRAWVAVGEVLGDRLQALATGLDATAAGFAATDQSLVAGHD